MGVVAGIGVGWRSREGGVLHDLVGDLVLVCGGRWGSWGPRRPDDFPQNSEVSSVSVRMIGGPSDVGDGVYHLVIFFQDHPVFLLRRVDNDV